MILLYNNNNITTTTTNKTSPPPCRCLGRCSYGPRQSSNAMLSSFSFFFSSSHRRSVPFVSGAFARRPRPGRRKEGRKRERMAGVSWLGGSPLRGFLSVHHLFGFRSLRGAIIALFWQARQNRVSPGCVGMGEQGRGGGTGVVGSRDWVLSPGVPVSHFLERRRSPFMFGGSTVADPASHRAGGLPVSNFSVRRLARPRLTSPPLLLPFFAHPVCGAQPPDFQSRLLPWRGSWLARIGRIV